MTDTVEPTKPMEWFDVHWHCTTGECWECGNSTLECHRGCAPFCACCVGYGETKRCYWCREPLLDPEEHPTGQPDATEEMPGRA